MSTRALQWPSQENGTYVISLKIRNCEFLREVGRNSCLSRAGWATDNKNRLGFERLGRHDKIKMNIQCYLGLRRNSRGVCAGVLNNKKANIAGSMPIYEFNHI